MAKLTGHLVTEGTEWTIPPYAQAMLWLAGDGEAMQVAGDRGAFTLDVPDDGAGTIDLTWGIAGGPLLARWPVALADSPVTLDWRGAVAVGGFVERLHAFEVRGLELVVAELVGALLPLNYPRLPSLDQMRRRVFQRSDTDVAADMPEFTYTLITMADSIHADYLHHAMVSELAVDCFTTLGTQAGRWHEVTGLPLLVEMVSLLAPG